MKTAGGKRIPGPIYKLAEIQRKLKVGQFHLYEKRAGSVLRGLNKCTDREARKIATKLLAALTDADYAHSLETENGLKQDVYGQIVEGEGWYFKIDMSDPNQPAIASCHPAEHDLKTMKGVVRKSPWGF
ncbi:MAG: hypothetical protein ACREM1_24360 [Longimicrobiales bacterium]